MANKKALPLIGGLLAGATAGTILAFLFGTEEGKKARKDLRKKFPEIFSSVEEIALDVKDQMRSLPSSLVSDMKLLMEEATKEDSKKEETFIEGKVLPEGKKPRKKSI